MKTCIIKQDIQERYNIKRGWFVNAYRIVSPETGHDLVQPWSDSKKEARETAKELGYTIVGWE